MLLNFDVDYLQRHGFITQDGESTFDAIGNHIFEPFNNDKFTITTKGIDYLHEIEEQNWTSIRSWIAIIISLIAIICSILIN